MLIFLHGLVTVYRNITFLSISIFLQQTHTNIYIYLLIPIRTEATTVKILSKYWGKVSGYNSYPHSKTLFHYMSMFYFPEVLATIRCVTLEREATISQTKNGYSYFLSKQNSSVTAIWMCLHQSLFLVRSHDVGFTDCQQPLYPGTRTPRAQYPNIKAHN